MLYFQIFFLMIVLGLFHGLIFLPVLLSLVGPGAYKQHLDKPIVKVTSAPASGAESTKDELSNFLPAKDHLSNDDVLNHNVHKDAITNV